MSERPADLLDEAILRRALRLEADEPLPRFDVRSIAALAERRVRTTRLVVSGIAAAAVMAVIGLAATGIWSFLIAAAPTLAGDAVPGILEAVVAIATSLAPVARVAAEPVVPVSLVAALGVAILYELRERREYAHARTS